MAFTAWGITEFKVQKKPTSERLLELMHTIKRKGLDRYEIAFRSWAAQAPLVADKVKKVDQARYDFLRSLFSEMGFEEEDFGQRLRILLVFHSAQSTSFVPGDAGNSEQTINRRHASFTRPAH